MRARVYERKADISPDGRWLIYSAYGHGPDLHAAGGGYTVISRPPSLTASFFAAAGSTWFGGGVFDGTGALALRIATTPAEQAVIRRLGVRLRDWPPLAPPQPPEGDGDFSNIHWRLARDGWSLRRGVYEKPFGDARLRKEIAEGRERHTLGPATVDWRPEAERWEWANTIGDEVVFASSGAVYRARIGGAPRRVAEFAAAGRTQS